MPFKISAVLFGHSLDVKALAITEDGFIISTSRDKTSKVWKPNGINTGFTEVATLIGHSSFVNCVCVLPATPEFPDGLILTGGNDKKICAFHPKQYNLMFSLEGHLDNVCCLSPAVRPGFVLSSSWDKSAKLWSVKDSRCVISLTGHELTVWAVLQTTAGVIVTGSADRSIRVHSPDGSYLRTLTGHKDCVRGLAAISAVEVLSCANDANIRKWNVDTGMCLEIYYGHNHYIYNVIAKGNDMVSGGEDRSVRVWTGKTSEVIMLPAQSAWAVSRLANGDVVTGSNDGVVRIFSADPDRHADEAAQAIYEQDIANFGKADEEEIGGVKVSDLPGREALFEPGKTDGQTKMIREGGGVTVHSWSSATGQWNKIGDVMGAQAGPGKTLYNGKEYDYVFSVDVEDGKPPLKLPYNRGEDPWVAAQKFIHTNDLSQHFLDTVANFIVTNSKDESVAAPVSNSMADPFTGGARYIPGGGGGGAGFSGGTDPFTGGSRYVPGSASSAPGPPGADPFTGGTRYLPNGTGLSTAPSTPMLFPQTSYLRFDQGNVQAILEKLQELNKTQDEIRQVSTDALQAVVKLTNPEASADDTALHALRMLLGWPPASVFPVLDVTRLALRSAAVNKALSSDSDLWTALESHLTPTALPTNQALALRVVCNMMSHPTGEAKATEKRHWLLYSARQLASPKASKALQIALATVLLNVSVACVRSKDVSCQEELTASLSLLLPWLPEPEAVLRGMVALGTLLHNSAALRDQLTPEVLDRLRNTKGSSEEAGPAAKVAACSAQILTLINAQ